MFSNNSAVFSYFRPWQINCTQFHVFHFSFKTLFVKVVRRTNKTDKRELVKIKNRRRAKKKESIKGKRGRMAERKVI